MSLGKIFRSDLRNFCRFRDLQTLAALESSLLSNILNPLKKKITPQYPLFLHFSIFFNMALKWEEF